MPHQFNIVKGFNDVTLRFCERCGLTHFLVHHDLNGIAIVGWMPAPELDDKGNPTSIPEQCKQDYSKLNTSTEEA